MLIIGPGTIWIDLRLFLISSLDTFGACNAVVLSEAATICVAGHEHHFNGLHFCYYH